MELEYLLILKDYLGLIWSILSIPILIIIAIIIIGLAKRKWKIKNNRKYDKAFVFDMILVLLISLCGVIYTIPVLIDISRNSITTVSFEYAYYYNQAYTEDNYGLLQRPIMVEKEDDSKIQLNDTTYHFPFEIENGTITYATHSRIILEYSGTVINQDSF